MKQLLMKVVLSLGVVTVAGGGLAASASAQMPSGPTAATAGGSVVEASCLYPLNQGLSGGDHSALPLNQTGNPGCWTSETGTPATVPSSTPTTPAAATPTTPTAVTPTTVPASSVSPDPLPIVPVASAAPIVPSNTSLAFTGADVWQTVLLGFILIGGGALVVRLGRQRRRAS